MAGALEPRSLTLLVSVVRGLPTGRQPRSCFIGKMGIGMGTRTANGFGWSNKNNKKKRSMVRSELAGQHEDSFQDVKTMVIHYFTYKAAKTVLEQLNEMDPTRYMWFYSFMSKNNPGDGKRFLKLLVKEKQDLAERVMITRISLYAKWMKECDHAEMYKEITAENLVLMRERLMETVIWPADDANTEKIG